MSVSSFRSSASRVDQEPFEQTFILQSRANVLLTVMSISAAVFIFAGIVRSAVVLENVITGKLSVLKDTKERFGSFQSIEDIGELVQKESFARMKYLSSGFDPAYYSEVTSAVNEIDRLFSSRLRIFQGIYFAAPEYRQYNCSFMGVRSNLQSRSDAVSLPQHRNLDERGINAWEDTDFYSCELALLADIQTQIASQSLGFDHIWQSVVAYLLVLRSAWYLQIGLNYAFLTRELVLKKGSVKFERQVDASNLVDWIALAQMLAVRAHLTSPRSVGVSCMPAIQLIGQSLDAMEDNRNATKAYTLVQRGDKFEYTTTARSALTYLIAGRDEYRNYVLETHYQEVDDTYMSIVSETVKLFIYAVILAPLACIAIIHMSNESKRLQKRYETCVNRYADSCKIIFRLLPEPVAKKLNAGLTVRPEFFHNVTIFHSDIVGFTTICSKLTAMEVLSLLNAIYTTFDNRTNNFKLCYKLLTIGDAYVVSSGAPIRNSTHAAEIASLALALVEEVGLIKTPQHVKQRIRVRIGISSGSAIAGIVGIKMLRYCLFGKTVLHANRMEQTSQPQKIQLSSSTYLELEKLGGFIIKERPKEEWPDKTPSFWLLGQTNVTPMLSMFSPGEVSSGEFDTT